MKKLLSIILFLWAYNGYAQDIIVKNNKSEVKAKVFEINAAEIKYKKWENLEGPLYSITKDDIFMIIYANGQREIINQSNNELTGTFPANINIKSDSSPGKDLSGKVEQTSAKAPDTAINYKNLRVKYAPTRFNLGFQAPLSIGINNEVRIVKNILNIGVDYYYNFPKSDDIIQSSFGFIYASLYAPINRLTGNYKRQDKGLFIFGNAGYGATYLQLRDFNGGKISVTSGGFTWRVGADYFILRGFGVTLSSYEFKSFFGGVAITI